MEYKIGTKFIKRYGNTERELEVEDILKTYNSKNELVSTKYVCFYKFLGQKVYDYDVCGTSIFRGLQKIESLRSKENGK